VTRIAVVNAGSSTLKLALMEVSGSRVRSLARLTCEWRLDDQPAMVLEDAMAELPAQPEAFGHRIVHGGDQFIGPTRLSADVERSLEALIPLAPLHNAPALAAIRAVAQRFGHLPGVAVFDTAFHARRAPASMRYALPDELVDEFAIRRYGFHGIAHASLVEACAAAQRIDVSAVSAVTLQLGAGCSACAVRRGSSVETSMGFTPLEGLVMATRCGSIDPAIVLRLVRAGYDAGWIEEQLTHRSGLAALAGDADMRTVLAAAGRGESKARLALDVFCRRIILTVGAYLTLLEGDGVIVFGGGIGTNAPEIRARVAEGLKAWNVMLDDECNRRNEPGRISAASSREVFALATDEETIIAREVAGYLGL
jgi:acetate kinase